MPSEAAIQSVWIWSLVIYFVVVLVVAVMLTLILRTARRIHEGVSAIWTIGQKVANNTIHIALLHRTNHRVKGTLDAALVTAGAVAAALFVALALYVRAISRELEAIGGPATRFHKPANYLSKIRLGLRAIEVHTGHIAPEVTRLNGSLAAIRDGLQAIDGSLGRTITSVQGQEHA